MYYNSKIDTSKTSPIEDIRGLLPHPEAWVDDNSLVVSKKCAQEFIATYDHLPPLVREVFKNDLPVMQQLARGY